MSLMLVCSNPGRNLGLLRNSQGLRLDMWSVKHRPLKYEDFRRTSNAC
jgi:hypothetical protein